MHRGGEFTIVQVRRIVRLGDIDPETVVTPGIYVDRLVEISTPLEEEKLLAAETRREPR